MADLSVLFPLLTGVGIVFVILLGLAGLFKAFYIKVDQGTALIVNDMTSNPKVHFTGVLVYPIIYKKELREIRGSVAARTAEQLSLLKASGQSEDDAKTEAGIVVAAWVKEQEGLLAQRYERELMNPKEALSLGSISQIAMPGDLRQVLGENMDFHIRHYEPGPMQGPQREFH